MYVMTVREPISRIVSHYKQIYSHLSKQKNKAWSFVSPQHISATTDSSLFSDTNMDDDPLWLTNFTLFVKVFPIICNNYFIRTLNGESVYTLPFGHIRQEHLNQVS